MGDDGWELLSIFESEVRIEILRLLLKFQFQSLSEIAEKLKDKGWKNKQIADEVGCTKQNVGQIVKKAQLDGYLTSDEKLSQSGFDYVNFERK